MARSGLDAVPGERSRLLRFERTSISSWSSNVIGGGITGVEVGEGEGGSAVSIGTEDEEADDGPDVDLSALGRLVRSECL